MSAAWSGSDDDAPCGRAARAGADGAAGVAAKAGAGVLNAAATSVAPPAAPSSYHLSTNDRTFTNRPASWFQDPAVLAVAAFSASQDLHPSLQGLQGLPCRQRE